MSKVRLPYTAALNIAEGLVIDLADACERIEIAGSIRRRRSQCGDIEIVCIPKPREVFALSAERRATALDDRLADLVEVGRLDRPDKNGDRYKAYHVPDRQLPTGTVQLDLFVTDVDRWGVIFGIRTGSKEFARQLVTQRQYGGRLRDGLFVGGGETPTERRERAGRVWDGPGMDATPLPTPEEADFFALAGGWVPPEQREVKCLNGKRTA